MEIRLWQWIPCAACGTHAALRFGEAKEDLLSGATLIVRKIPEYACPACGYIQRELISAAAVQEAVEVYLDQNVPDRGKVTLELQWELSRPIGDSRTYQDASLQSIVG